MEKVNEIMRRKIAENQAAFGCTQKEAFAMAFRLLLRDWPEVAFAYTKWLGEN